MSDTIDITNLVSSIQSTFVTIATNLVMTAVIAVPGLQWLNLPIIRSIVKASIGWIIGVLANDAMLGAFFLNTAVKSASQAQDYVNAVNAKNNLPQTANKEEYAKAEQAEISAFNSFVRLTN